MKNLYKNLFVLSILISITISCKTGSWVDEVAFKNSSDTANYIGIFGIFNNKLAEGVVLLDSNIYNDYQLFLGISKYRIISHVDYLHQQKVFEDFVKINGRELINSEIEMVVYQNGKLIKSLKLTNEKQLDDYVNYLQNHFNNNIKVKNTGVVFYEYEDWKEK